MVEAATRRAVEARPGRVLLTAFGPRVVCRWKRIIGNDTRPNWKERPERESLTGKQWQ
jgi:hypothetical protein